MDYDIRVILRSFSNYFIIAHFISMVSKGLPGASGASKLVLCRLIWACTELQALLVSDSSPVALGAGASHAALSEWTAACASWSWCTSAASATTDRAREWPEWVLVCVPAREVRVLPVCGNAGPRGLAADSEHWWV